MSFKSFSFKSSSQKTNKQNPNDKLLISSKSKLSDGFEVVKPKTPEDSQPQPAKLLSIAQNGEMVLSQTLEDQQKLAPLVIPCHNPLAPPETTNGKILDGRQDNSSKLTVIEVLLKKNQTKNQTQKNPLKSSDDNHDDNHDNHDTPGLHILTNNISSINNTKKKAATKNVQENILLKNDLRNLQKTAAPPAYDKISVDDFGLAMLRGMGYKPPEEQTPEENLRHVEPYTLSKRAYAKAGLGAPESVLLPHEKKTDSSSPHEDTKKRLASSSTSSK